MMKDNPLVNWLPMFYVLKFLDGRKWNVKVAYDALVEGERWRYENGADTLTC